MPAAIAPDDTSTTCRPRACRAATASTIASSRAGSSRPREVSDDEPTFTTVRAAAGDRLPAHRSRCSSREWRSLVGSRSRLGAARPSCAASRSSARAPGVPARRAARRCRGRLGRYSSATPPLGSKSNVTSPIVTAAPRRGAEPGELLLDAEPVRAGRRGSRPPRRWRSRSGAPSARACRRARRSRRRLRLTVNPASSTARRLQHDPGRLGGRTGRAVGLHRRGERVASARAAPGARRPRSRTPAGRAPRVRDAPTRPARAPRARPPCSARPAAAWRAARRTFPSYCASSGSTRVEVAERVAARVRASRSRGRAAAPRSARRGAGSAGRGPCPARRRGSARGRRRR